MELWLAPLPSGGRRCSYITGTEIVIDGGNLQTL
jgi:hypothetical protein